MTKHASTPGWKRRLVWDNERQHFVSPPTYKQLRLVQKLAEERGIELVDPVSKDDAKELIRDLIALQRGDGLPVREPKEPVRPRRRQQRRPKAARKKKVPTLKDEMAAMKKRNAAKYGT